MPVNSTRGGASAKAFGFTAKGAAGPFTLTISSPQTNLNLATYATSNGWPGTADATITVDTGVWIYSTSVPTPGLTTGAFPGGLTIINNGYIAGMGGNGGGVPGAATAGGNAISLGTNVTINNTNPAAFVGGGGGGGGITSSPPLSAGQPAGGGAGGGAGGDGNAGAGGTGGAINGSGGNGNFTGPTSSVRGLGGGAGGGAAVTSGSLKNRSNGTGGGGGRIFPGTSGAGGTGNTIAPLGAQTPQVGGAGGAGSAAGGTGSPANMSGGGGGWGASGGSPPGGSGGSGGKAVALNGFSVTWTSGDTARVFGAVS